MSVEWECTRNAVERDRVKIGVPSRSVLAFQRIKSVHTVENQCDLWPTGLKFLFEKQLRAHRLIDDEVSECTRTKICMTDLLMLVTIQAGKIPVTEQSLQK